MRNSLPTILICDDDELIRSSYEHHFHRQFNVFTAADSKIAETHLKTHPIDVVILDVEMTTPREGIEAIQRFLAIDPELGIIMCSGYLDFELVRDALKLGAFDYIPKNRDIRELELAVFKVLRFRSLKQEQARGSAHKSSIEERPPFIGSGIAAQELRKFAIKLQNTGLNVVITGETGVGKEVFAKHIVRSPTDGRPGEHFVAVDSSTIQSSIAESMLFGHEKGAFTGASERRIGLFEQAHNGIIYFDEIGNMPIEIQAKLLRVLQEKTIRRVGAQKTIQLDFRVVCASNKKLEDLVEAGQFKPDLLQRLSMVPVDIPPLRERREDIPEIIDFFLGNLKSGRRIHFTRAAENFMQTYAWPGNIRELRNTLNYLVSLTDDDQIDIADFPQTRFKGNSTVKNANLATTPREQYDAMKSLKDQIETFERNILESALKSGKSKAQLARDLKVDRSNLYMKFKKYDLLC